MAKTATVDNHAPLDTLDSFAKLANTYPQQAIMLMFWKMRHANPEFSMELTGPDIEKFKKCVDYLEVQPEVRIFRPAGTPAQDPIPATGNRRAVPGRPAKPPKNFVVIQMVDQNGDAFVPIEDNVEDQRLGQEQQALASAKQKATTIAGDLLHHIQTGTLSTATIQEAAGILQQLARA